MGCLVRTVAQKYSREDTADAWELFDLDRKGGVTSGSLFYHARRFGWRVAAELEFERVVLEGQRRLSARGKPATDAVSG